MFVFEAKFWYILGLFAKIQWNIHWIPAKTRTQSITRCLFEPFGIIWNTLSFLRHLETNSSYLGLSGTIWDYLKPFETIWNHLGYSRKLPHTLEIFLTFFWMMCKCFGHSGKFWSSKFLRIKVCYLASFFVFCLLFSLTT